MADNPLSTQMQALITYANETTGENDAKLDAAVGHLVDGYGSSDNPYNLILSGTFTKSGSTVSEKYKYFNISSKFESVFKTVIEFQGESESTCAKKVTQYFTEPVSLYKSGTNVRSSVSNVELTDGTSVCRYIAGSNADDQHLPFIWNGQIFYFSALNDAYDSAFTFSDGTYTYKMYEFICD